MDDSFSQSEPGGEFAIVAGRAHDHRDAAAFNPNLERLLGRDFIGLIRLECFIAILRDGNLACG